MTSSKTTVLGIRLDHERRGWIEAEAARQGLSIRAYFERMIDKAGFVGQDPVNPTEPMVPESVLGASPVIHDEAAPDAASVALPIGDTDWSPPAPPNAPTMSATASPGLCDDLLSVAAIPGRVLRGALGLPCAVTRAAARSFLRNRAPTVRL
jgi:hypothetical protein